MLDYRLWRRGQRLVLHGKERRPYRNNYWIDDDNRIDNIHHNRNNNFDNDRNDDFFHDWQHNVDDDGIDDRRINWHTGSRTECGSAWQTSLSFH